MAVECFPGFIDVHVHLREPGATQKEDFFSGTRAAVQGGFTYLIDMPNNVLPTISLSRVIEKEKLAKKAAICTVGFHFGTNGKNTQEFKKIMKRKSIFGLKLYLNHTTGEMLVEDLKQLMRIFEKWDCEKPILLHAEQVELAAALGLGQIYKRRLHVCHMSRSEEVELVRRAKSRGIKVTAGVCPHHLFLTSRSETLQGSQVMMKPQLGEAKDVEVLWAGIRDGTIDVVESDHAPHTLEEKKSDRPPFGVPGLETTLGLMFLAVLKKKITKDKLVRLLYANPRRIFNIPGQPKTYVEIDVSKKWRVGETGYQTKCGWSPFAGWELPGKVVRVVILGNTVLDEGKIVI